MAIEQHLHNVLGRGDFDSFQPEPGIYIRYARFEPYAPPRGQVVLAHGRSEFIEKYAEVIGELLDQGFQVWTMDWRGQGLLTRLLPNHHKGHVVSFDDYLRDFDAFVTRIVNPAKPPILLAHSMGGHLALRYVLQHPRCFAVAVLSAPMVGVHTPVPVWLLRALLEIGIRIGLSGVYVSGGNYGVMDRTFHNNPLTLDHHRFQRANAFIDENPQLAVSGMTLGWLAAALRSMAELDKGDFTHVVTPILMACAGNDRRVDSNAARLLADRMPRGRSVFIVDSEHEILMERQPIRERFWALFREFVGRSLAGGA